MTFSQIAILGLFPAAMAFAAASDLVTMTISNRLCLVLIAAFPVCALAFGLSFEAMAWHFAAGALVLCGSFGLFAAGWIGGGDAKLVAATALWFGFDQLMAYLLVSSAAGGALVLAILAMRQMPLPAMTLGWPWAVRLHSHEKGVPYGIALAFGALAVLPETAIWRAALGV